MNTRLLKCRRAGELVVLCLIFSTLAPGESNATRRFCNKTSGELQVALAMPADGALFTTGWFDLKPGICVNVPGNYPGTYFTHARAVGNFNLWWGNDPHSTYALCASSEPFKIIGWANCGRNGFKQRYVATCVQADDFILNFVDISGDKKDIAAFGTGPDGKLLWHRGMCRDEKISLSAPRARENFAAFSCK